MRLWKEAWATVMTGVGLILALSVTQGWNWPLLGDARAGIIALGVVGFGACITSSWSATAFSMTGPFAFVSNVAGMVLLGAGVIGLFANALPDLVVMMGATFVLWLVATVRRLVAGSAGDRRAGAASKTLIPAAPATSASWPRRIVPRPWPW
jgi:hypothetical protein